MAASPATWTKESLIEERRSVIGYNCALNYSRSPLVIVGGKRSRLFDEAGESYLDCVNNVCHVGHCHPDVVAAASDQLAVLNTNSRYLSPYILDAAKRITATMPAPLRVVYWVNSGSEANDLALRLARAATRKRGVVCVDGAYHGHVTSIIDISPYKFARAGGAGPPSWVRVAAQPDVFSGAHRGALDDDAMGAVYAADVTRCIESLAAAEAREARAVQRATWTWPTTASQRAAAPSSWSPSCPAAGRWCRPRGTSVGRTQPPALQGRSASRMRSRSASAAWGTLSGGFSCRARTSSPTLSRWASRSATASPWQPW